MAATTPMAVPLTCSLFFRRPSVTDTITPPDVEVAADSAAVSNPYTGQTIASVPTVGADAIDSILERAKGGRRTAAALSRASRAGVLEDASRLVDQRAESFARLIVAEAGKTITQARKEVARAVNTLALSAAEARRNAGEVVPFDSYQGSEGRQGWFTREPLGIIAAITPFNDPLNLVAHKLGPAIAGGNAVILKPSALTPDPEVVHQVLRRRHQPPGGEQLVADFLPSGSVTMMKLPTGAILTARCPLSGC
jgi:acyl-CoA reductase-like NAD-dependent aldehyde dehydrogenase